jgi:hypothetical protein
MSTDPNTTGDSRPFILTDLRNAADDIREGCGCNDADLLDAAHDRIVALQERLDKLQKQKK